MEKLFAELVAAKRARLELKGSVYTGSMQDGKWVPDSLHQNYREFGSIVDYPKVRDDKWLPEGTLGNLEFIGGTKNRGFYMDMSILEKYPNLKAWFAEGDSHLLAGMFLRPGKLAAHSWLFLFPSNVSSEETHDGLLMTLGEDEWQEFLEAYALPACTWAQVTVFHPNSIIGKGSIRRVLEGEEPTLFTNSWKWLRPEANGFTSYSMSVMTTDSAYRPQPSVNRQEYTYAKAQGGSLAAWVLSEVQERVAEVVNNEKYSPDNVHGFLAALGLPAPDKLLEDVVSSQYNGLLKLLKRWPVTNGWRGKASASSLVERGSVLLPTSARGHVKDTVWVGRNPALPKNGYVTMQVAGYVPGNIAVFNADEPLWCGVLGGDFDGDDAIVLYAAPFEGVTYEYGDLNLQSFKSDSRKIQNSTINDRLQRWQKEVSAPIGVYDIMARKAIDLGVADDDVLMDLTNIIQLAISLKKRLGNVEDSLTDGIKALRKTVGGDVGEATETQYLSKYAELNDVKRKVMREVLSPNMEFVLTQVEEGIEAIKLPKPRFTLLSLEDKLTRIQVSEEMMATAMGFYEQYLALVTAKAKAMGDNSDNLVMTMNREMKMFTQVTLPEHALSLSREGWVEFSAALYFAAPESRGFWLYSVHPGYLLLALKDTYAKEKQMLFSTTGHSLEVGDKVPLLPHSRHCIAKGKDMTVSNGIVMVSEPTLATVTKVYAKSVIVELG